MLYVKTFATATIGAILAAILYFIISFVIPLYVPGFFERGGGIGAVSLGIGEILIAALIGFVAGGWWGLNRFAG